MESNSKSSGSKSSVVLAILCVILSLALALALFVQGILKEQLFDLERKLAYLESDTQSSQKNIEELVENAVQPTGLQGPRPGEDLAELLAIQETVTRLYREFLRAQLGDQIINYDRFNEFMTVAAITDAKEPRQYETLSCGQSKRRYFNVNRPKIAGNKSTVEVTAAYVDSQDNIKLELIKQDGKWLVNNVSCPDISN